MNLEAKVALAAVGLFFGMMICAEIGRRVGAARLARDSKELPRGVATADAALLSLLGLLIAFTFSGAASRFENRRTLISTEAIAIRTAYLRVDLLPADTQPAIRELFRHYVDVRSTIYRTSEDEALTEQKLAEGTALQKDIWNSTLAACRSPEATPQAALLIPALNAMVDITITRATATQSHPPVIVFVLLGVLSLIGALLLGYGTSSSKDRSWLHMMAFSAILSLTVYVIIDLEYPRLGLIRVDAADHILMDLRKSM